MKSGSARTVFMIALDGCEPRLLEAWTDEGALPALAALRERGAYGRLSSTASILTTSAWPSFLSGTPPEVHGGYHYLQWRPKEMQIRRWHRDWIDVQPFWRDLTQRGVSCSAVDVPWVDEPREPTGVELSGFACLPRIFKEYATVDPARYLPRGGLAGLGSQLVAETGAPATLDRLRAIVEAYIEGGRRMTEVALGVMRERPAGFSIVALSAAHLAGHVSWSEDGVRAASGQDTRQVLEEILRGAYLAVDRAVGRLVEAADRETLLMIFSLNGMEANTSRTPVLSQMLGLVLKEGKARQTDGHRRLLDLRRATPLSWRSALKRRLPVEFQDGLHLFWRGLSQDPSGRRAFSVDSASEGFVRINLKGREARGVVDPGREYEELCAQISVGLASFKDADTGEALVQRIDRIDRLLPAGARRSDLPDLIVRWSASPAARHRRIVSAEFGCVDWPTPGKTPDGRSGNHSDRGFLIACGQGIVAGSEVSGAHILDLPPTVFAALGEQPPSRMTGRVLDQILG